MGYPVGPAAVLAAGPVPLTLPMARPGEWAAVIVYNATPFLLLVEPDLAVLQPFTADRIDLGGLRAGLSMTAAQAPGGPAATTVQSYAMATFLTPDDDTPADHYPLHLAAQVIAATVGP